MTHHNEIPEVRKPIVPEEFAGKDRETVLHEAKTLLAEQRDSEGVNRLDGQVRNGNLSTLQKLIDDGGWVKDATGKVIKPESQLKKEAAAAEQQKIADRKAAIMHKLRSTFAGTDDDFERLKDRLYDEYLLGNEDEDSRRARELMQRHTMAKF